MHIPDAFVSGPLNLAAGAVAVAAVGASAWRVARAVERRPQIVPVVATTAAFVFAAQMLNFPIGGGTSGHFLGAAAVAALLGPSAACLVMSLVLVIQCLAFADGGITALGSNVLNMGVVGGFGAYLVVRGVVVVLHGGRGAYLGAAAAASWLSVVLAAGACALELAASGTSPLAVVLPAMLGVHAVIGVGEALITVALLSAVIAARPDILPEWSRAGAEHPAPSARRVWTLALAGLVVALVLAALAGPVASRLPDGLERVAQQHGFVESAESGTAWTGSPLADYLVPGVNSEHVSTSLAGMVGTVALFAVGFAVIKLIRRASHRGD